MSSTFELQICVDSEGHLLACTQTTCFFTGLQGAPLLLYPAEASLSCSRDLHILIQNRRAITASTHGCRRSSELHMLGSKPQILRCEGSVGQGVVPACRCRRGAPNDASTASSFRSPCQCALHPRPLLLHGNGICLPWLLLPPLYHRRPPCGFPLQPQSTCLRRSIFRASPWPHTAATVDVG